MACSRVNITFYLVAYIVQGMDKIMKTAVKDTHFFINMPVIQLVSFLE